MLPERGTQYTGLTSAPDRKGCLSSLVPPLAAMVVCVGV